MPANSVQIGRVEVVVRHWPLSACEAAVYAMVGKHSASVGEIWARAPRYCKKGRVVEAVGYGTIQVALTNLCKAGFIQRTQVGKRKWEYYRMPNKR